MVVNGSEGDGNQQQISQSKEEIFYHGDKDLKLNYINDISCTDPRGVMNKSLNDVLTESHCNERADMVEELVDVSTGDGVKIGC